MPGLPGLRPLPLKDPDAWDPEAEVSKWSFDAGAVVALMENMATEYGSAAPPSVFDSVAVPKSSLRVYAQRIYDRFGCSAECFVMAMFYLEQLLQTCPRLRIKRCNAHRLLLTSVVLATKNSEDSFKSNADYAAASGVSLQELNSQEALMLELLQWRLFVHTDEYSQVVAKLRKVGILAESPSSIVCKAQSYSRPSMQRSAYRCAGARLGGHCLETAAI